MPEQALYDLSPTLRLMAMGLVLALAPLAWIWLRQRRATLAHRLRVLTLFTLFLTFDLVLFGAFTRLTDSGLGCPTGPAATVAPAQWARWRRFATPRRPCRRDRSLFPKHGSR